MIVKEIVLEFVARQADRGLATSYKEIAQHFQLPDDGAAAHLGRLWRYQLVVATIPRRAGYKNRLEPGESLYALRFRLTSRGRGRLTYGWRPWAKDAVFPR